MQIYTQLEYLSTNCIIAAEIRNVKNYHLIALGGSVMHNLAIDLKDAGHRVTGSDDEIYEPSRSRLREYGLLPNKMGWFPEKITDEIDVIILGKHAKNDNPELLKAQNLGLPITSFPEFVAQHSAAKKKIAITGSHGKTTTTSMVMHVLKKEGLEFDYLVGAQIDGFEKMVKISGAPILVVEGDEYPSSCLDDRAKMLHYKADVSVITGVAWDHVNIYKTYDAYLKIFQTYLEQSPEGSKIFFDQSDDALTKLILDKQYSSIRTGYAGLHTDRKGAVVYEGETYPIQVFGQHNLKNLQAAMLVCQELKIEPTDFLRHIGSFSGAAKRLELLHQSESITVYKDFAHAPSKAKATAEAVRSKYRNKKIKAILELHTFSSLSQDFIHHYKGSLDGLDSVAVFYDPAAMKLKRMPDLDKKVVATAFKHSQLQVLNDLGALEAFLQEDKDLYEVVLIMSSGNLGGLSPLEVLSINE